MEILTICFQAFFGLVLDNPIMSTLTLGITDVVNLGFQSLFGREVSAEEWR